MRDRAGLECRFRLVSRLPSLLYSPAGEVAEWLKAPLSKSGIRQRIAGSNPALSASAPSGPGLAAGGVRGTRDASRSERCESGLIGTPGKRVFWQRNRGFESRPLRSCSSCVGGPNPRPTSS